MKNIIAVFGKMRESLTPGLPNEPVRLTVTRDGVDVELPYHSQVACVELEPTKVFNLAPARGVVAFDSLRWPSGAELTSAQEAMVLKEVLDNVSRSAYECPVKFFIGEREVSVEEAQKIADSEINGGEDDAPKDESSVSGRDEAREGDELQSKSGRPDAEQKEKPKRGRPRK